MPCDSDFVPVKYMFMESIWKLFSWKWGKKSYAAINARMQNGGESGMDKGYLTWAFDTRIYDHVAKTTA